MSGLSTRIQHVVLLGLGEAGTALATGLCQDGGWVSREPGRTVSAIDPAFGQGVRGAAMMKLAESLGMTVDSTYGHALENANLVISVVTGIEATSAARSAAQFLSDSACYADFNSITGPQTQRVAAEIELSKAGFIDVAVMGSFMANGHRTPLLLSGPAAESMMEFAGQADLPARILNERIGDASAVKILRSVLMKGLEALTVECLVAARRQGLVDELLDNVSDVDQIGFAEFIRVMAISHLPHAKRRMEEVEKAIENLAEAGVPALMSDSTRRSHARTVAAALDPAEITGIDLAQALEILDKRVVGQS